MRFLALTSLLFSAVAAAGTNSWTLTGPEGGPAASVAFHPTDAATELLGSARGVHRTVTDGAFWTRTFPGDINDISILVYDPTNEDRVFAAGNAIYRSTDEGRTFGASIAPAANMLGVTIANDGVLYTSNLNGRLFRSQNSGTTWVEITTRPWTGDFVGVNVTVDPSHSNTLYARISGTGIYKSMDAGVTWSTPQPGSPGSRNLGDGIRSLAVDPANALHLIAATSIGLMRTIDGGASWSTEFTSENFAWVGFDPVTPDGVLGITTQGQIYRSADRGVTWPVNLRPPRLAVHEVTQVALSPVTAGKLIVATSEGPMLSVDGGATFELRVANFVTGIAESIAAADDGSVFTAMRYPAGLFRRSGRDWAPMDNDTIVDRSLLAPTPALVAVAPRNANHIYVADRGRRLMRTSDGATWIGPHAQFLASPNVITSITAHPEDAAVVYLTDSGDRLWRSGDLGATWQQHGAPLPAGAQALAISAANPNIFYLAGLTTPSTVAVFRSDDAGLTWTAAGALPGTEIRSLTAHPDDPECVFAVLPTSIARSTNRGASWTVIDAFGLPAGAFYTGGQLLIDPVHTDTWWTNSSQPDLGFLRSVNGGATWQSVPLNLGGVRTRLGPIVLNPQRPGLLIGGVAYGGMAEYEVSPDLGIAITALANYVVSGGTATARVTVTNNGPHAASPSRVTVTFPVFMTPASIPAGCGQISGRLDCDIPALQVGQSQNVDLAMTVASLNAAGGVNAVIDGHEPDAVTANDFAVGAVISADHSNVGVTLGAVPGANVGGSSLFTATVSNAGPHASPNTYLQVEFPQGAFAASATPSQGSCVQVGTAPMTWNCELGTVNSGATATVTLGVRGDTAARHTIEAGVSTGNRDAFDANDTATTSFTVTAVPASSGGASGGGGGGGGGGRFDWLALGLLALVLARRVARR